MTSITLHGEIGERVGRESWKLKVGSIREALRAIQALSKGKLLKYLIEASQKNVEYKILINKREIVCEEEITVKKPETILNSELMMVNENLSTLDIVPIIKGAGGGGGGGATTKGVLAIVLGVILIATGVGIAAAPATFGLAAGTGTAATLGTTGAILATAAVGAGISLAITGITLLTMSSPKFEDFRKIENNNTSPGYLFDGPANILGEGGPVPVGYGRLKVGSQTVEVSMNNKELRVTASSQDVKDQMFPENE